MLFVHKDLGLAGGFGAGEPPRQSARQFGFRLGRFRSFRELSIVVCLGLPATR